jgi:hypothetical protein
MDHVLIENGIHTATLGEIDGRRYASPRRIPAHRPC